jgi:hypothetical protein
MLSSTDSIIIFYDSLLVENKVHDLLNNIFNKKTPIIKNSIEEITIMPKNNIYSMYYQIVHDDTIIYKTKTIRIDQPMVKKLVDYFTSSPYVVRNDINGIRFNNEIYKNVCVMDQHFRDYYTVQNNILTFNHNRINEKEF